MGSRTGRPQRGAELFHPLLTSTNCMEIRDATLEEDGHCYYFHNRLHVIFSSDPLIRYPTRLTDANSASLASAIGLAYRAKAVEDPDVSWYSGISYILA